MKIRRYVASNTQEAILKVKMDLGSEALIINTRKVRKKGLKGLFSKPMIEVLAAVDEYSVPRDSNAGTQNGIANNTNGSQAVLSKNAINSDEKEEKIANLENKILSIEETVRKLSSQVKTEGPSAAKKDVADHKSQVSRIADIFYSNLTKNEVDPDIARKLIDTAIAMAPAEKGVNDIAVRLYTIITDILGRPDTIKTNKEGKPTVVVFVGPTGVGKTTTLAKIAANFLLAQNKTVGLITADTYRIAAVEQLKTYAEILGIPVSVVYTASEIKDAINQHADKDLVLIDTAGRSHKNKTQVEELKELIRASNADEIYLVLSATTSTRNCRDIIESYSFLKDYKLIFTKTDETPVYGLMLNIRYMTGKSLSYITTGQSVPDDIETANIEKITKNLIGSYTR